MFPTQIHQEESFIPGHTGKNKTPIFPGHRLCWTVTPCIIFYIIEFSQSGMLKLFLVKYEACSHFLESGHEFRTNPSSLMGEVWVRVVEDSATYTLDQWEAGQEGSCICCHGDGRTLVLDTVTSRRGRLREIRGSGVVCCRGRRYQGRVRAIRTTI